MTLVQPRGGIPVIAAFDFDGTITTRDTFIPFLYRAFGKSRVLRVFVRLSFEAAKMGLGLSSRDELKSRVIRTLFQGDGRERLRQIGREYAGQVEAWFRPKALERIEWHRKAGHRLVLVSASLDLYLETVAKNLGFDDLLCTTISVDEFQMCDGRLVDGNCRGLEKVRRLEALLGDLCKLELYAYGDSAGDKEMLEVSNHAHYRPFRS